MSTARHPLHLMVVPVLWNHDGPTTSRAHPALQIFILNTEVWSCFNTSTLLLLNNTNDEFRKAVRYFHTKCNLMAPQFKKKYIKSQLYDVLQIGRPWEWLTKKQIEAVTNRTKPMGSDNWLLHRNPSRTDCRYLMRRRKGRAFVYSLAATA